MKCPRCQAETPSDAEFCPECGAKLAALCPQCGTANAPTHKFCKKCGQPLTAPAAASRQDARFASPEMYTPKHLAEKILTSKSALEGERKQVTVLFADLKGSMELLADRDPEEARQILDPVLELMMEAVHRYEGTVNQITGDGIMALFGAPLAHEDHAVRACYTALRMQDSVHRYAEDILRSHGVSVQIRVGLNSGEVVVRSIGSDLHMDYTAVGQTTHLAARMEQIARPGSILLTGEIVRLAEGFVQVKPLGPVPVKGLEAPIEVYEVLGAGPARTRLQAAVSRGLTRFVGRDAEMEALRQALDKAQSGHGQVVALVGEPGVGKSRLFWEFTRSHRTHGWLILESGSVSYGKATIYLPLIDLLKAYFQIQERDDERKIREKLSGKLVTLDETLMPMLPVFLALLDVPVEDPGWQALDPPQRRQRTLDACKRLLLRESQVQPLCLVFEDLHWIDSETQAFLDSLVESLPTARILLLVNYRPEYEQGWGSKTYYSQLRIDPLPPASAEELLQALLGEKATLQPLKKLLIERTEGNPFFLEESVQALLESRVLVGERGAYRLAKALPSIEVPATVQAVLAARIDRLPPDEKRLLQAASVIGKDVPLALLQAIAEAPEETLRQSLAHLQAAEFLYETSLFPELEYTFKHALTHEVAYSSLLKSSRQQYHHQIAQAVEERFPGTAETRPELLAHHYTAAGLAAQAVGYWQRAGRRASERSAHLEAIRYISNGLELLKALPDTPERAQQELTLQLALIVPLTAIKGYGASELEPVHTRARELCQKVGNPQQLVRLLGGQWMFYEVRAELQTARDLAEQVFTLAQRMGGQHPGPHMMLSQTLQCLGEFLPAREHAEQGIALYDSKQHSPQVVGNVQDIGMTCMTDASRLAWLLGYPDQALKRSREALAHARRLSHPYTLVWALLANSRIHQAWGEPAAFQEWLDEGLALAIEHGFAFWVAAGTIGRGWALAEEGRREEGIELMRQGLASQRDAGAALGRPGNLALLAQAYGNGGQAEEGLSTLDEALHLVDKTGESVSEAELYRLKGELLLKRAVPDEQQAEACFQKGLEVARRQSGKSWELRAAMSVSRLRRKRGKRDEAHQLLADTYGWFTEGFNTRDLKEAQALLRELS